MAAIFPSDNKIIGDDGRINESWHRFFLNLSKERGVSDILDDAFGDSRGTLIQRGETEWEALAPGTSGYFIKSNGTGADLSYAEVTQPTWELIANRTVTGNESFTDLSAFVEIIVILDSVTASSVGNRYLRVSINNGSSFLSSSGDYVNFGGGAPAAATEVVMTLSFSTAVSSYIRLTNFNKTSVKVFHTASAAGIMPTASALNALQIINSAGTPNGGTIRVLGFRG